MTSFVTRTLKQREIQYDSNLLCNIVEYCDCIHLCGTGHSICLLEGTVFLNSSQPVIKTNISDKNVIANITDILRTYARRMEKASETIGMSRVIIIVNVDMFNVQQHV